MKTWIKSFEETGSAERKKKLGEKRPQRNPKKQLGNGYRMEPQRTGRKHAAALNLNITTVCRILPEDFRFQPYTIYVLQELKKTKHVLII